MIVCICFYDEAMRLNEFDNLVGTVGTVHTNVASWVNLTPESFIRLSGANDVQLGERRAGERRLGDRRVGEQRVGERRAVEGRARDRGGGDRRAGVVVHVAVCGLPEKSYSAY